MSRLIDADKLQEDLEKVKKESATLVDLLHIIEFQIVVDEQPTAFDVDKVVVKLEAQSEMNLKKGFIEVLLDEARPYLKAVESFDKAIEIIRRGGIDE